eukprot:3568912-Lingulodinium_polyedra.AAC.1
MNHIVFECKNIDVPHRDHKEVTDMHTYLDRHPNYKIWFQQGLMPDNSVEQPAPPDELQVAFWCKDGSQEPDSQHF